MKRFKDILCVLDPGEACKATLERAVTLAEDNQASLTIVGVIERVIASIGMPKDTPIAADLQVAMVNAHAQGLEALIDPYRKPVQLVDL